MFSSPPDLLLMNEHSLNKKTIANEGKIAKILSNAMQLAMYIADL